MQYARKIIENQKKQEEQQKKEKDRKSKKNNQRVKQSANNKDVPLDDGPNTVSKSFLLFALLITSILLFSSKLCTSFQPYVS